MVSLNCPITDLRGIGKVRAADLHQQGIYTVEDLLLYAPLRYEDRSAARKLAALDFSQPCLTRVRVKKNRFYGSWRRRMRILEVEVHDETGVAHLMFFNQPYLAKTFVPGSGFYIYGLPKAPAQWNKVPMFQQPDFERIEEENESSIHMGRVVPIYRRIGSCTSRMLRSAIHALLSSGIDWPEDVLPRVLCQTLGFPPRGHVLTALHFPQCLAEETALQPATPNAVPAAIISARRRLKFEEIFFFFVWLLDRKAQIRGAPKSCLKISDTEFEKLKRQVLPFPLTRSQERAVAEILSDMAAPEPMCRLLQGDVGSGKTVVALMAVLAAISKERQSALMAPTEVLAEQHYLTFERWLRPTGARAACLTSSLSGAERLVVSAGLKDGSIALVIGTQALIQQTTQFKDLGLAIIDEQHRFGVLQRFQLGEKGKHPDLLAMTATPIPRSLAMTLYGDLDVSVLDELPPGRRPVRTMHFQNSDRPTVYERIRRQISKGRQVYFVCPLVHASNKLEVRDVERSYQRLAEEIFPDLRVGLLHGRLPSDEKLQALTAFQSGSISILVCTTVIEVGIDVPNATLIVVENAERFGLAQLHQLRGRVGRGAEPGECILLTDKDAGEEAAGRLQILCETNDGFRIAEEDLLRRGPGDLAGLRQSGLADFRFINLTRDQRIIERARCEARKFIDTRECGEESERERIIAHVRRMWEDRKPLLEAG